MIDALYSQLERLLKLKHLGQRLRGVPHPALPLLKVWIGSLKPGEILLPFANVGKKLRQVPLLGLGDFRAHWNMFTAHLKCG